MFRGVPLVENGEGDGHHESVLARTWTPFRHVFLEKAQINEVNFCKIHNKIATLSDNLNQLKYIFQRWVRCFIKILYFDTVSILPTLIYLSQCR